MPADPLRRDHARAERDLAAAVRTLAAAEHLAGAARHLLADTDPRLIALRAAAAALRPAAAQSARAAAHTREGMRARAAVLLGTEQDRLAETAAALASADPACRSCGLPGPAALAGPCGPCVDLAGEYAAG